MQTDMTVSPASSTPRTKRHIAKDLGYLAARLHGRRSRMAEGERLEALCRLGGLDELFRTLFPDVDLVSARDFQGYCVLELVRELSGFHAYLAGPGADLLDYTLVRLQVENLKTAIRGWQTKTPAGELGGHLLPLPAELTFDYKGLAGAESLEDFVHLVPKGDLRESLEHALKVYPDHPRPFFLEAALDHGYFQKLLSVAGRLPREDQDTVLPVACQEVDTFHLMLVARGKFHYGLAPDLLRPLHVGGTRIPRGLFVTMLADPDLASAANRVAGRVFDAAYSDGASCETPMSADSAALERLAWKRFVRLANLAFRKSHMGLGAVYGYVGLRRVEVANLITICEGIRGGLAAETIRGRMIPGT